MSHFLTQYASSMTERTLDLGAPFGTVTYKLPSQLTLGVRPGNNHELLLVAKTTKGNREVDIIGRLGWAAANGNPRNLASHALAPDEVGSCRAFRLGEREPVHAYTAQDGVAGVLTAWGCPQ